MDIETLLKDPRTLPVAGGALLAIVLLVVLLRRAGSRRGARAKEDAASKARQRLLGTLRAFRDDLKKALAAAGPVFRKIETQTEFKDVVGHWRKQTRHRIAVRSPSFSGLKAAARELGLDAMPLSDLEVAWKPLERQVGEYNAGALDDSRTPIATIRSFEKDLEKVVVLANICLKSLGG